MIKANISKKIGNVGYSFQVENEKAFDVLAEASIFGDIPEKCGLCESENVHLNFNQTKDGFKFLKVICKDCNGRSQLGSYKTGGYFWKNFEQYTPGAKKEDSSDIEVKGKVKKDEDGEPIPF